jgi:hypothetical protein
MKPPVNIIREFVDNYLNKNEFKYKIFIDQDIDFDKALIKEFVDFCLEYLGIQDETKLLKVVLSSQKNPFTTYAFFNLQSKIAAVYCKDRAILDCFRSLAHELVHYKQDIKGEISNDQVSVENDGNEIENEANSIAGIIMRKFGRLHKELY